MAVPYAIKSTFSESIAESAIIKRPQIIDSLSLTNPSQNAQLTVSGDITIGNQLVVHNKVGINVNDPKFELDVNGRINAASLFINNVPLKTSK